MASSKNPLTEEQLIESIFTYPIKKIFYLFTMTEMFSFYLVKQIVIKKSTEKFCQNLQKILNF